MMTSPQRLPMGPGLAEEEDICPTNAVQREGGQYMIVDSLCIRRGACKEQSPEGIEVRHRFAVEVAAEPVAAG